MANKLTDRFVSRLDESEKPCPYEMRDSIVSNLFVRVSKTAKGYSRTYKVLTVTDDGKRKPLTLGKHPDLSAAMARELAQEVIATGTLDRTKVVSKNGDNPTLEEFARDVWLPEQRTHTKTADLQFSRLWVNWPKDWRLQDITVEDVRAVQMEIATRTSGATANRNVASLSSVLSLAAAKRLIPTNPARMVRQPKNGELRRLPENSEGHKRFFTPEEWDSIEAALADRPRWFSDLVRVAIGTGCRKGELLTLNWSDVDLVDGAVMVKAKNEKTSTTRRIPLTAAALRVLQKRAADEGATGMVWAKAGDVTREMDLALERAGITKTKLREGEGSISFRTLRATYASWLVQKGAPIFSVSKLLGHGSVSTTEKHYAHLAPSSLEAAVMLLD